MFLSLPRPRNPSFGLISAFRTRDKILWIFAPRKSIVQRRGDGVFLTLVAGGWPALVTPARPHARTPIKPMSHVPLSRLPFRLVAAVGTVFLPSLSIAVSVSCLSISYISP